MPTDRPPVTVIYHADCIDGFGSAYAAWAHFGDDACYRPLHHGEAWKMSDIAGHDVFILDFSFPPEVLESMASAIARGGSTAGEDLPKGANISQLWSDPKDFEFSKTQAQYV